MGGEGSGGCVCLWGRLRGKGMGESKGVFYVGV